MIRMHRVAEDVLPRMERVRSFRWQRLFRLAARSRFALRLGFRSFHVQQRQIVDGSRPEKFRIVECGIVMRPGRKLRERHYEKDDMPQSRGNQCPARKPALNPAIFEESFDRKSLGHRRFAEDHFQAAANPLMKTSPGDTELWRTASRQTYGGACRGGGLSRTTK